MRTHIGFSDVPMETSSIFELFRNVSVHGNASHLIQTEARFWQARMRFDQRVEEGSLTDAAAFDLFSSVSTDDMLPTDLKRQALNNLELMLMDDKWRVERSTKNQPLKYEGEIGR